MPFKTLDSHDLSIKEYYGALDCPRSLACWLLYESGEHKQLAEMEYDPFAYANWSSSRDALAATKFLSKAKFLKTKIDKKQVALEGFYNGEKLCEFTNERFASYTFSNPYTLSILENMRVKIARVLGEFAPEEFVDSCDWGPGATTLLKRAVVSAPKKFDVERQITPRAYGFVKDWFHIAYPQWEMMFEIVSSSKIVTVDKNAKTDRVIAIEPGLNLWFQKGIGAMIRRRLKSAGIDLNDQRHNQRLSRLASIFNDLATVDFSAASDTIAYQLINYLLPSRWFSVLNAFRVESSTVEGKTIKLEKFSSMGNGFTFELESLIFWALAEAVCFQLGLEDPTISVYGDDVVLPSSAYALYKDIATDIGFSVNAKKSYSFGPYRESCGSHYIDGRNAKPIFLKEALSDVSQKLKLANAIRRFARSRNSYGCDLRFKRCWLHVVRSAGERLPSIGDGYGDLGLVVNPDERDRDPTVVRASHGWEGYYTRVWALSACQREFDTLGLLLSKLKAVGSCREFDPYNIKAEVPGGNTVPLSGRYRRTRRRMYIPTWPDLGPWC